MASHIDIAAPSIISGVWNKKETISQLMEDGIQVDIQVEIHNDSSSPTFSLPCPTHAITNTISSCTRSSVMESPICHPISSLPPSYSSVVFISSNDEAYSAEEEPLTLARMLFKYGFLCFPFWIAGIYILCSPLRPTPEWEAGKTETEKDQQLALLRKTELKWARRCLLGIFAMIALVFLSTLVIKFGILQTI